ncbi:hypothetical protein [Melittangium boletus]|uniref:PilZ domain-containing protein n=1 Tax=Melittangium boletus DSM 14713 TaxID=1294270 RepID=A0A250IJ65_9BACT|nr:hypothetical protein [Melittangium boletus]ATB31864.1 hypothetical protein MEBOL_005333 [Melittangium boletus DSM 14713]
MDSISNKPARSSAAWEGGFASPFSGYSLQGAGAIQVNLPEWGGVLGPATLLSPAAVWARPGRQGGSLARERTLRVCLETEAGDIGPLKGEIHWNGATGEALGIQLLGVSPHQGERILTLLDAEVRRGLAVPEASPLPVQEEITGGERLRAVLRKIAALGNQAVVRRPGQAVRMTLERLDEEGGRLYWRCAEPGAGWGGASAELEVVGYNSAYRMHLETRASEGGLWVTSLPERLWRVRHRWHRRVLAPEGTRARFEHPLWSELGWHSRDVVDVSYSGLSLRSGTGDLLFPGLFLPLEVETAHGERISLRCEVRHVSFSQADGRRLCGLEARPLTPRDSVLWMRFVSQTLSPSTRSGEAWLEPLWDLYAASGYFNLAGKSSHHFDALRRDFIDLSGRAAKLPHVFCQTVWPSERGVEASLSAVKPYQNTWMLHHLGRRPGKPVNAPPVPGQILRDIYQRTLEHAQVDPDFRWLISYAESTVPWVRRTHLAFAERAHEGGESLVMYLRLMDAECSEMSGEPVGDVEIGPASMGEKLLLAREIARTRPASYADSLDLTRERLELRGASRFWKEEGLRRERRILVARREGVAVAALVLELGPPATNLFRLMDCARLFPLLPEGKDAYVALLDEARRWFAFHGRTAFVYLCEDEGGYARRARLHDDPSTQPFLWIISASLAPEFLEHIQEQSVGRQPSHTPSVLSS